MSMSRKYTVFFTHGLQRTNDLELYRMLAGSERCVRYQRQFEFPLYVWYINGTYAVPRRRASCCEPIVYFLRHTLCVP